MNTLCHTHTKHIFSRSTRVMDGEDMNMVVVYKLNRVTQSFSKYIRIIRGHLDENHSCGEVKTSVTTWFSHLAVPD